MDTQKQAIKFFYYARASSAELLTQSIISKRSRMMIPENANHIVEECRAISRMINKLIAVRLSNKHI
ncbi:MAG: four helix bundle protein [Halioglobus sp.]|jgi:four helix bundle protein